ncbi:hypothetical protein NQ314_001885 [Rhamnusium bicolor]|uniref:Probable arginine--tRNA ligase, mitochondrial n=1 Tax=Rhamnusium bicolor TaxID=1586634 RepID=A0AAV8ZST2_9CUCU|nr:hypothetical protein NQ314_001885 [Rhamnusium bicolor]
MSTKLKLYLGRKVIDSLHKSTKFSPSQLQPLIQIGNSQENGHKIELNLPLNLLETQLGVTNITEILKIKPDDIIKNIHLIKDRANRKISFEIDTKIFMKDVLENCAQPDLNFKPKNIVVEYSSPNIAKPFHLGHLRSTIIGNFISNLNKFLKNKVTRINYLGDWGTQFGFIKVGVDDLQYTPEVIQKDPLKLLYQSYVHANNLADKDPNILEKAKAEFAKLENGSEEDLKHWRDYMSYTKTELQDTYNRIGVSFDEYNYESDYSAKDIQEVVDVLRKKNIVHKDKQGKEVALINERNITLVKSDGTTLYLTRDIAAAFDRFKKYKFDRMYYVVENGQNDHFHALKSIIHKMDMPWSDRLTHVKFGRIRGMSTRKGTAVFLKDILDECRDIMIKRQVESPTTKVPISDDNTADILGVSCVIINDLKQRRQKDYDFDWDRVLQVRKSHHPSIFVCCPFPTAFTNTFWKKNSGAVSAPECVPEILQEPEVVILLKELAKFHDVFNHISKALKLLQIKGMSPEVASQRLLLFVTARNVLKNGMSILGITPLNEM